MENEKPIFAGVVVVYLLGSTAEMPAVAFSKSPPSFWESQQQGSEPDDLLALGFGNYVHGTVKRI